MEPFETFHRTAQTVVSTVPKVDGDSKIVHRVITFSGPAEKVDRQIRSSLPDGIYPGLAGGVRMLIRTAGNEGKLEEIRFDLSRLGQMDKVEPRFDRGWDGLTVQTTARVRGDHVCTYQFQGIDIEIDPNTSNGGTLIVYDRRTKRELGRIENLGGLPKEEKPNETI